MKIKTIQTVSNAKTWEDLRRFASMALDEVISVINGRLSLIDNLSLKVVSVNFNVANEEKEISHGLGFVPNGYIVVGASAPMSIYDGLNPSSASIIYLKSSAVGTARVIFF